MLASSRGAIYYVCFPAETGRVPPFPNKNRLDPVDVFPAPLTPCDTQ